MVNVYANLIEAGRKTLEEVPETIRGIAMRELVRQELIRRGYYDEA